MLKGVGSLIVTVIDIYILLITVRIIISWLHLSPYKWVVWLCKVTDPFLNFFSKHFPIKFGMFNLSPILGIFVLYIVRQITADILVAGASFNMFYIAKLLIILALNIFHIILFIMGVAAVVLIIIKRTAQYVINPFINAINSLLAPFLRYMRRNIKITNKDAETIYLALMILALIVTYFLSNFLAGLLLNFLAKMELNSLQNLDLESEF